MEQQLNPDEELQAIVSDAAAQMREILSNLHIAAVRLAPPAAREQDAVLDRRAAVLDQSYYRLFQLANDLDTAARLERGEAPEMLNENIVDIVRSLCERCEALAQGIGITLEFSSWKPRQFCELDRGNVEKVCYHLLANALKYTEEGGRVSVTLSEDGEEILLTITDTGCGMTQTRVDQLNHGTVQWNRFAPTERTGFSVYLCRQLMEQMGGRLLVQSTPGKGTTVQLWFQNRLSKKLRFCDQPFDYAGGFNKTLLGLADALPLESFFLRQQN